MAEIANSKLLGEYINLQFIEADTGKKAKLAYAKKNKLSKWFVIEMAHKINDLWYLNYVDGNKYFDDAINVIKQNDKSHFKFYHEIKREISLNYDTIPKDDGSVTFIPNPYLI